MSKLDKIIELTLEISKTHDDAAEYAEHLSNLLDAVNPEKIGADYKEALNSEDYRAACHILASYYRAKPRNTVRGLSADNSYDQLTADRAIEGYAREVSVDWKFENGEVDFLFNPTELEGVVNHEWLWQFNRHRNWPDIAKAYVGTNDEKYALGLEKQILKWIAQARLPEKYNTPGSAWRTIECGIRLMGSWPCSYDGLIRSKKVNDLSILLMIASMLKQTNHLLAHSTRGNWLMMEMTGVYTFSSLFDEICAAEDNAATAANFLIREISEQILPDGMHNELTPDYQSVVFSCAMNFYSLAKDLGKESSLPQRLVELIKDTVKAAIDLSTPAFTQPRTNDCYTIHTSVFTKRAASVFGNTPEWEFVNTRRLEGKAPEGETASRFLPYAGFIAMRDNWNEDSAYLCFDVGPLGAAHIHQDKLNINVYKGSEELIFDDGGGQYDLSEERKYALTGYDHNSVLVDGLAQQRSEPYLVDEAIDAHWRTTAEYDFASAVYDGGFGTADNKLATHKRSVRFLKPDIFCVTDTLTSLDKKTHSYEILFQLDTTSVKRLDGTNGGVVSDYGKKYDVVIIPLDSDASELKIVSAMREPYLRGWYNGRNEENLHEATTVSREISNVLNCTFTTLIIPGQ